MNRDIKQGVVSCVKGIELALATLTEIELNMPRTSFSNFEIDHDDDNQDISFYVRQKNEQVLSDTINNFVREVNLQVTLFKQALDIKE